MISTTDIFQALGFPQGVQPGGNIRWLLATDSCLVECDLRWDRDERVIAAEATETDRGGDSRVIAWLKARESEEGGFEWEGEDKTGEASVARDPQAAAAAIRRQIQMIAASSDGRVSVGA